MIAIPEAVAGVDSKSATALDGVGEMPAGVPMDVGTMKSSRFIGSSVFAGLIV